MSSRGDKKNKKKKHLKYLKRKNLLEVPVSSSPLSLSPARFWWLGSSAARKVPPPFNSFSFLYFLSVGAARHEIQLISFFTDAFNRLGTEILYQEVSDQRNQLSDLWLVLSGFQWVNWPIGKNFISKLKTLSFEDKTAIKQTNKVALNLMTLRGWIQTGFLFGTKWQWKCCDDMTTRFWRMNGVDRLGNCSVEQCLLALPRRLCVVSHYLLFLL